MILSQFQSVGCELSNRGLVSSHSGNLSIRLGENVIITRRGSQLGCLEENDLIETGVSKNTRATPLASIELPVHRAIYQHTAAQAIVHAHPPHAIALSLTEDEIILTNEWLPVIGKVPVLGWNMEKRPGYLADIIAEALNEHHIVMVHGHGSFAIGQLLDEAYSLTSALEAGCQVNCLFKSLQTDSSRKASP
ncbi:MAG: aldolase [Chloroflexota bacterium]